MIHQFKLKDGTLITFDDQSKVVTYGDQSQVAEGTKGDEGLTKYRLRFRDPVYLGVVVEFMENSSHVWPPLVSRTEATTKLPPMPSPEKTS